MDIPKIYNLFTETISNLVPGPAVQFTSCICTARAAARSIRWTKKLNDRQKADAFSALTRRFRKEFTEEYGDTGWLLVAEGGVQGMVPVNIGYLMYSIEAKCL